MAKKGIHLYGNVEVAIAGQAFGRAERGPPPFGRLYHFLDCTNQNRQRRLVVPLLLRKTNFKGERGSAVALPIGSTDGKRSAAGSTTCAG